MSQHEQHAERNRILITGANQTGNIRIAKIEPVATLAGLYQLRRQPIRSEFNHC